MGARQTVVNTASQATVFFRALVDVICHPE
jgi:hypothetical protein